MPIEEVTPGVARLKTLMANIYLVGSPGGPWVLVDTGTPGNAARIRRAAEQRFGADARPSAILLTHGHRDHAGSARELAEAWDVPIYAHRLERPFLTGKAAYPPKEPLAGGAFAFFSRFFPGGPVEIGDRLHDLPEGGEVPGLIGWRWHFTPGHAPGHVAFFQRYESTLLAGDACVTMDLDSAMGILTEEPRISRPPSPYTYDWDQAAGFAGTAGRSAPHGDRRGSRRAHERRCGDGRPRRTGVQFPTGAGGPLRSRTGPHGRAGSRVPASASSRSRAEDRGRCGSGGGGDGSCSGAVAAKQGRLVNFLKLDLGGSFELSIVPELGLVAHHLPALADLQNRS